MIANILIVEDNIMNMTLFVKILEAQGYTTFKSNDGSDAIEIARNQSLNLIIMDIHLPDRSGLEIARELKTNADLKHIPIIAVSAYTMAGDKEKMFEAGCDDYFPKPIFVSKFLKAVETHLN